MSKYCSYLRTLYFILVVLLFFFFFSSRRRHTRLQGDWSSDVCSSDLREFGRDVEPLVAHTRREERAQPTVPAPDVEHGRAGRDAGERARLAEPHPLLAAAAPGAARTVKRGQLGRRRTDLRAHGPSNLGRVRGPVYFTRSTHPLSFATTAVPDAANAIRLGVPCVAIVRERARVTRSNTFTSPVVITLIQIFVLSGLSCRSNGAPPRLTESMTEPL